LKSNFAEFINNIHNEFKKTNTPRKVDWAILVVFCIILFVSHIYWDLVITTKHGINIWYALEQGKLNYFYSFNINAKPSCVIFHSAGAAYDIIVYFVFAIWNFPLWVLERFFDVNIFTSLPCLLWMKAILLPFLLATASVVYKTCIELKIVENNAKWAVFIFMSSGFVLSSIFVIGQYDIISVFLSILGLLLYIKGKNKWFVFLFAIAISFKLFALLIFIPLVLLKEKRIMKIVGYVLVSISLTAIQKFYFAFDPAMKSGQDYSSNLVISKLFNNQLQLGLQTIYIYIFAFVGLCIFCYVKNINNQEELNKFSIYIPFASLALLFMFTPANPYWTILMTPYFPIMIFLNPKYLKINLVLDTILSSCMIIVHSVMYSLCYQIKTIEPMIMPRLFGEVYTLAKPLSAKDLYVKYLPDYGISLLITMFTVCLAAMLIINFPRKDTNLTEIVIEGSVIW